MAKQSMTPRERAIYEHEKRKKAAVNRKKRAEFMLYAARVGILALVAAALFGVVLTASILLDFSKAPKKHDYTLNVTVNGEKAELSKDIQIKENICYVSLSSLSKVMGFSMSGDVRCMNAVFPDGDIISFMPDTDTYTVNGVSRKSDGVPYVIGKDGDLFVPVRVFEDVFSGISLGRETKGKKINYTLAVDDGFEAYFDNSRPLEAPDMSQIHPQAQPEGEFITDLSAYEIYMNPENADEYIRLINTSHPLGEDYVPADLINISYTRRDGRATQKMREAAAKSLDAMFMEMYANGFTDVTVTSAYRDFAYQKQLFDNKLSYYRQMYDYDTAYAKTATENAIPGTSEHQSGLCADLHNLPSASQRFEAEAAYKWLTAHCADFGFILRYPKNKQDITGIIYEPWHFRFVGRYHAQKITRSGLCLEEYCAENGIGLN